MVLHHSGCTSNQGHVKTTPVGFEPTRGDPIRLAGRRLNHSAKVSSACGVASLDRAARWRCPLKAMRSRPAPGPRPLCVVLVVWASENAPARIRAIQNVTIWKMCGVEKMDTLLDLCMSSLRGGRANLLCIVPSLTDDPRTESKGKGCRKRRPRPKV